MEMFVLLTDQTRGKEGWSCALEKCGELVCNPYFWSSGFARADSWDLKWTKEHVRLVILNLQKC